MNTLQDFQFEIFPSASAAEGVVFGIYADVSMDDGGFHPGATEWLSGTTASTANGTTQFGRELLLGPVWAWDLHINRDDCENAVETLGLLTTAWRALQVRKSSEIVPLRYKLANRIRRVYGRPGMFEASPNNLILSGMTPVTCDFTCVDAFTYADEVSTAELTLGLSEDGGVGGGLVFPVVFPTGAMVGTEVSESLTVGGDAPASAVYRLNGPWTDPAVYTDEWRLSLPNYEIPAGHYVEIDTRPWMQTVMLDGVTSIGGLLGRRQKLYEAVLQPGDLELNVGGYSTTGAATCQVTWRDTFNSI